MLKRKLVDTRQTGPKEELLERVSSLESKIQRIQGSVDSKFEKLLNICEQSLKLNYHTDQLSKNFANRLSREPEKSNQ